MIQSGELRHKITFQTLDAEDDFNRETFTDAFSTRAKITNAVEEETEISGSNKGVVTHIIECRYKSSVTPKHRIKFKGRFFNILGLINVDERSVYLKIKAEEII